MATCAAGCRAHPQQVQWGAACTLRIQHSFDDVSVGAVREGELSACTDSAPRGTVYVYGRDPACPHGWLWFSDEDSAESLQAKIENSLATSRLSCRSPA